MQLRICLPVETAKCWWLLKIEPNVWVAKAAVQSVLTFKLKELSSSLGVI